MIERADENEPALPPHGKDLLAFAVDAGGARPDLPAWRRLLAASDIRVEAETPFTLYFRDPDGRRVAVSTYVFDREGVPRED